MIFSNKLAHQLFKIYMKKVYYISGLGADERVFTKLKIDNAEEIFIKWEKPQAKESIQDYSKRLINQIDLNHPIILIGVSFGGIIAQEIANHIQVEKIYVISSVKSENEYGIQLKFAKFSNIYKLVPYLPVALLKKINLLTGNYYFSIQSKNESNLLKAIIHDTNDDFLVWAIHEIMIWKKIINSKSPTLIHIHGDNDRIFTKRKIDNVIWIENGGHFMIYNRAKEISNIINASL